MSQRKSKQLRKLERRLDKLEKMLEAHQQPWWWRIFGKSNAKCS